MAKTRIKTTPTRMQKEALMASAAVTTTTNIVTEHVFKKRLSVLKNSITAKEPSMSAQSTIIVQPPKRTNSISSTTSNISHTSDGNHSCAESPPPVNISTTPTQSNGPTMAELTENAIKTLNAGLLAKSNALALKNRKVYMITEKCDDAVNGNHSNGLGCNGNNGTNTGQKRKMYLIMEEKESDKNGAEQAEKLMKTESNANASNKKLTLFTDTSNGQLPQKFEKILPEILNCIQAKKGTGTGGGATNATALNGKTDVIAPERNSRSLLLTSRVNDIPQNKLQMKNENNERLPLTLPPKKNRTKIITTQIIPVHNANTTNTNAIYQQNNGNDNWSLLSSSSSSSASSQGVVSKPNASGFNSSNKSVSKTEKSSGATPVIVNASTLLTCNGNSFTNNGIKMKENTNGNSSNSSSTTAATNQLHKNINLSTDFLFLMKMLPKLESIEEPHKNYVKNYIEDIINQYAVNQIMEQ